MTHFNDPISEDRILEIPDVPEDTRPQSLQIDHLKVVVHEDHCNTPSIRIESVEEDCDGGLDHQFENQYTQVMERQQPDGDSTSLVGFEETNDRHLDNKIRRNDSLPTELQLELFGQTELSPM